MSVKCMKVEQNNPDYNLTNIQKTRQEELCNTITRFRLWADGINIQIL